MTAAGERSPLLRVSDLVKTYGRVRAVDHVSFEIGVGETLGCVGESGCGKTTLGRAVLRLVEPDSGAIEFRSRDGAAIDVRGLDSGAMRRLRREMQIVFQDPYSALNPRFRVRQLVGEAIAAHGIARGRELERRVVELLEKVGLASEHLDRYPHEFSGGQRQRINIARAIALEPRLLVCDEPVSALDVSVQAQVVNLFERLKRDLGLAYLFISHDLAVVRHLSDRVIVLYLGEVVETGPTEDLFAAPRHPYTRALLAAVPVSHPSARRDRPVLPGDPPSPSDPPSGCRFRTRCPLVQELCAREAAPWRQARDGHRYRCHFD